MRAWIMVACLLLVVSCTTPIPLQDGPGNVQHPSNEGRPDIPRSNLSQEYDDPVPEPVVPYVPTPVLVPSIALDVPLGEPIGKHHPLITGTKFPLLHHAPIRVTDNLLIGYEEQLRFDFGINTTGHIVFGKDRYDNIGTFLSFAEGKPIFEYSLTLSRGTFEKISGRELQIMGHTYIIGEATNTTVVLYGRDVPFSFVFSDNKTLTTNGSRQGSTVSHVTPNRISYTLYSKGKDKGILLSPGERLSENTGQAKLGGLLFDIRYAGAPTQNSTTLSFDRNKFGYKIHYTSEAGIVEFPLVEQDGGKLILGKVTSPLRVAQCTSCVAPGDMVLLSTPLRSYFMTYSGISNESKLLIMRDLNGNRYDYKFIGNPGIDARTDIIIDGDRFPVRIGKIINNSANITIERFYNNGRADLVMQGGFLLRIGTIINATLPLELIVPASRTRKNEEKTPMNLSFANGKWTLTVGNVTFIEDEETDDSFGTTLYGAAILLDKKERDLPINAGEDATILLPLSQTYGTVELEG